MPGKPPVTPPRGERLENIERKVERAEKGVAERPPETLAEMTKIIQRAETALETGKAELEVYSKALEHVDSSIEAGTQQELTASESAIKTARKQLEALRLRLEKLEVSDPSALAEHNHSAAEQADRALASGTEQLRIGNKRLEETIATINNALNLERPDFTGPASTRLNADVRVASFGDVEAMTERANLTDQAERNTGDVLTESTGDVVPPVVPIDTNPVQSAIENTDTQTAELAKLQALQQQTQQPTQEQDKPVQEDNSTDTDSGDDDDYALPKTTNTIDVIAAATTAETTVDERSPKEKVENDISDLLVSLVEINPPLQGFPDTLQKFVQDNRHRLRNITFRLNNLGGFVAGLRSGDRISLAKDEYVVVDDKDFYMNMLKERLVGKDTTTQWLEDPANRIDLYNVPPVEAANNTKFYAQAA